MKQVDYDKLKKVSMFEVEDCLAELSNIMDYVSKLDNVNPGQDVYTNQIDKSLRDDIVVEFFDTDELLKNASESEDGYFVIKRRMW